MDISYFCVFLAFLMNYITEIPVLIARFKDPAGYNNYVPREQEAKLTGWAKRAYASHMNSFEAFPAFAAAVIIAHLTAVMDMHTLTHLSIAFIVLRVLHMLFYLANLSTLRSTVWLVSVGCIGTIFVKAIF